MRFIITLLFLIPCIGWAQGKREKLTLEDIHVFGKTYPKGVWGIRHMDNGTHYSVQEDGKVVMYDYKKGKSKVLFDQEEAKAAGMEHEMSNYHISGSGEQLLIETNTTKVYRHSKKSTYYLWNFKTKKVKALFDGKQVFYATLSPDEKKVAFVFENNLYIEDIATGKTVQITTDGERNKVLNGMSDWVYEEEFVLVRAFEWSSDSRRIAFVRFDESEVRQYQIPVYNEGSYPDMYTYKYPKAGEDNSRVMVKLYDVANKNLINIDLGGDEDIYIPRLSWTGNGQLTIHRLNRLQNHLELLAVDSKTGGTKVLYEEKSKTYIDIDDDLTFLSDGSFILSSEKDGFNHLYHYAASGKLIRQITKGKFDVTQFIGYDKKSGDLYYQSAEKSPLERHLYKVGLDGKGKEVLDATPGTHQGTFSANYKYYIHTFSTINTPPVISIKTTSGRLYRVLEDNLEFQESWKEMGCTPFEFIKVSGADGTMLNGWELKPKNFSPNEKYPLLMFVYGGPGSQMVKNTWYTSNKGWFQYLAQNGYYIVCVDNRGTGARGADFKKGTYKQLGVKESEDQIAVANALAEKPYIDENRVGMFGWSYGGYMTSLCLAKGDVFKTGIAVAPVTSWAYYDNIYTERFMQRPIDNPEGYANTTVMNHIDGLRSKNYLLVHGSFDDNVHPQNAYVLMKAMVDRNISFDSEIYVNKNHGIGGGYTRIHLYKKMTNFIKENL